RLWNSSTARPLTGWRRSATNSTLPIKSRIKAPNRGPRLGAIGQAATGVTAVLRFRCADECAHELAINFRSDGFDIDAVAAQECACVLHAVNGDRFDFNFLESGCA